MVNEGLCTKEEALLKIDPNSINALLHPRFDEAALKAATPVAAGLPSPAPAPAAARCTSPPTRSRSRPRTAPCSWSAASPAPRTSRAWPSPRHPDRHRRPYQLTRPSSPAAWAPAASPAAGELHINEAERYLTIAGIRVNEGEVMSIDGNTGNVYVGAIPTVDATISGDFATVMGWADEIRALKVRTNADTPARRRQRRPPGRRGHRPHPYRAHVLRRRPYPGHA